MAFGVEVVLKSLDLLPRRRLLVLLNGPVDVIRGSTQYEEPASIQ